MSRFRSVALFVAALAVAASPVIALGEGSGDSALDLVLLCRDQFHKEGLADSHLRVPRSAPWLALREGDIRGLEGHLAEGNLDDEDLPAWIREWSAHAGRSARKLADRLTPEGRAALRERMGPLHHQGDFAREILSAYLNLGEREARRFRSLPAGDRREWVEKTLDELEPSIKTKGRFARKIALAPLSPFVYGWMGQHILREYYGPKTPEFEQYIVYSPALKSLAGDPKSDRLESLLSRYSPIIVQEIPKEPDYPPTDDLIGRLVWRKGPEGGVVLEPDVRRPAVYAYAQRRRIGGEDLIQLIYTHWYAEHPPLKFADAEAGKLEGLTIRITLDTRKRPLVYETIYDCGCYHRMYVSRRLETLARERFGEPLSGKTFSIEKKTRFKIDLVVLDALRDPEPGEHPILFCWAAYHLPGKIALGRVEEFAKGKRLGEKRYALLPYAELENSEWNGISLGVFNPQGLIWGGGRREGLLLSPSGIYYAGHPRQRGTQMIHFDQEDFEDPNLFTEHLRWPGIPKE
ncbi:MAG: hypothetical protein HUU16_09125 [Candidatus Omnitrophica bacterium]|nr:hypothetical protein [bacterium]NUN96321.1 hypothetical protein [Candidatus Omnitrophota bacterium]